MRSNVFREGKISISIFSALLIGMILFFLISTMFVSMGYKNFEKDKAANANVSFVNSTVIIDPGHGGVDPGASANGLLEKDLNLDISLLLSNYLTSFGYDCVLTRSDDVLLFDSNINESRKKQDLYNRVHLAESYNNAYFVSIHMNKFPQTDCKGFQAFYSNNNKSSKALAESLQSNILPLQPQNHRAVKNGTDSIYVLEHLKMPAVLIECGFLSNYEEAELLKTDDYKMALALSIYCGIAEYLENNK